MKNIVFKFYDFSNKLADLPLLLVRLLLAYGFWAPAKMKWANIDNVASWFEHINIPLPKLNAYLAASTEMAGVFLLLFGIGTRLISIPLIIVMIVAIVTVHLGNGWLAIASSEAPEVAKRLDRAKNILKENGNYEWLTEEGSFVILQNGIEFPATYIVLLLILISFGPGRVSLDYFIERKLKNN